MTYKIHPWQINMLEKINSGVKTGEKFVITTGRRTGKSVYQDTWNAVFNQHMSDIKFKIYDKALVDGDQWYTVGCIKEVSNWMRTQPKGLWHEHIDEKWTIHLNRFDIHEKIYTQLALKWS
jgi:hypothetical protein